MAYNICTFGSWPLIKLWRTWMRCRIIQLYMTDRFEVLTLYMRGSSASVTLSSTTLRRNTVIRALPDA